MNPVLFQLGPLTIYTYGFALTVAIFLTTFQIWRRARKLDFRDEQIIDMILVSLFISLVFARAFFVFAHQDMFKDGILQILLVTYFPGLDGVGALLGGFLGFWFFGKSRGWQMRSLFDCIVKGIALGISVLMLGAFFSGSYVGKPASVPWAVVLPGFPETRHPVALYYALYSFILFVILTLIDRQRRKDGLLSSLFLVFFGLALVIFEWYTEGSIKIYSLPLGQVFGLGSILAGIYLYYFIHKDLFRTTTPATPIDVMNEHNY